MFLKSLTLRGFKSFANKTTLEFEPGTTMIVGPNGSGKSNLTDAVLWVLGEQSPSSLRGNIMEDVIFSGTLNYKALGLAEATICLDNSDQAFPLEFNEVTISRRMFRTGESDYLLNGIPCRLMEIQDLLSDSGLGRNTHSIIGQGKIEEVINCKPDERRQLIEEAAGVLKHKKRKERALRRLVSMEEKLTRVKDILREINRQLKPLKTQANQAKIFSELKDTLRKKEVALNVQSLSHLQAKWSSFSTRIEDLNKIVSEQAQRLTDKESQLDEMQGKLEKEGLFVGDIHQKRQKVESLLGKLENNLVLLKEKEKNLAEKIAESNQKSLEAQNNIAQKKGELSSFKKQHEQVNKELEKLYRSLKGISKEAEKTKKQACGELHLLEDVEKEKTLKKQALEELSQQLGQLNTSISSEENKIRLLEKQIKIHGQKKKEIENKLGADNTHLAETSQEVGKITKELQSINLKEVKLAADFDRLTKKQSELKERLANEKAKLKAINKITEALLWDPSRCNKILKENKIKTLGFLAKDIKVKAKYSKAIEAVFEDSLYGFVFENYSELLKASQILKEASAKAQLFINKSMKRPNLKTKGLLANQVVKASPRVSNIVNELLKSTVIINSLADANPKSELRQVTLQGEVITPLGVKLNFPKESGLLGYKQQQEELQEEIDEYQDALTETEIKLASKHKALKKINQAKQQINNQLIKAEQVSQLKKVEIEQQKASLSQTNLLLKEIIGEQKVARLSKEKLEKARSELEEVQQSTQQETSLLETKLVELKQKEKESQLDNQKFVQKISSLKVEIASANERNIFILRQLKQLEKELSDQQRRLETERKINQALLKMQDKIEPIKLEYSNLHQTTQLQSKDLEEMINDKDVLSSQMRTQVGELKEEITSLKQNLQGNKDKLEYAKLKKAQTEVKVNDLAESIINQFEISLEAAIKDYASIATSSEEVKELKEKLSQLGPINEMALAEFEELSKRQEFLESQIGDLQSSKKALSKVIKAIDRRIKEEMLESFEKVNDHFQKTFSLLFPGGTARLRMTDEDDVFNTGIEIEAQPAGKNIKRLTLLSGGETALAALALLFAIYHTRPSPFYVLDEVEAALDDINLQRFIHLLNEMKPQTQFIVITHQRRTMEIADSLYGVTMQANGVSKLISQKLIPIAEQEQAMMSS